ncbi:MAG: GH36-type glycosyl hydrolase domain-containing protein [Clostridium sp.]
MGKNEFKKHRRNLLKDLNIAYNSLREGYKRINICIKNGGVKTTASEWILDNTYLLEREFNFVKKNMPEKYFFKLPTEVDCGKECLPRTYLLAKAFMESSSKLSEEELCRFILSRNIKLSYGEVVSFPIMLRIYLLIDICGIVHQVEEFYLKGNLDDIFISEELEEDIEKRITELRITDNLEWKIFFDNVSEIERYLLKDPSGTYPSMEEKSKDYYRHKIEKISRKFDILEEKVAEKAFELARKKRIEGDWNEKTHIGYYIVDSGYEELLESLNLKGRDKNKKSEDGFIFINIILTLVVALIIVGIDYVFEWNYGSFSDYIVGFFIILLPCSEIIVGLINYFVPRHMEMAHIPKIDFKAGIGEENKTTVVIPTIIENKEKIKSLVEKLEVYYLGNKDPNAYFVILGDFVDSKNPDLKKEEELNLYGKKKIQRLNDEYGTNRFFFLTRERLFNKSEEMYIGWERKRGKLIEFMELLRGGTAGSFKFFSSDIEVLKESKYLITLDTDTFMKRNTLRRLVGAMAHPLNSPKVSVDKIIRGYGMMQPKVSISLESKNKTRFSKIFGGDSGVDGYSTAYSDTYQDLFGKGSFTGKGIIHIDAFLKTISGKIKENRILSHDLLEGELARCGLVTDCELIEEYPSTYMGSISRLHRWVRGDFQIINWLFSKELKGISKWKIFDNLRRSLLAPWLLIGLWLAFLLLPNGRGIVTVLFLTLITPLIFRITDFVVTPKNKLNGSGKTLVTVMLIISFTPYQAVIMLDAMIRSIYRLGISKKNLLKWRASDIEDKGRCENFGYYIKKMWFSIIAGLITVLLSFYANEIVSVLGVVVGVLWVFSPYIAWSISKSEEKEEFLTSEERMYLLKISRDMWGYYGDLVNLENNYLPPDNYQEEPLIGEALRTSPTNIGLSLICNIVAYDLGFINLENAIYRIQMTLKSMEDLERWNGHFLNWYDIRSKTPLHPKYVSTVDSGNLLSYLMIVKKFMKENYKEDELLNKYIDEMNFKPLYNDRKELFYIGYNMEEDSLGKSYYDLLASEARIVSFLAIARGEAEESHWFKLKRSYRNVGIHKTLLSWSGTMFEYLMPSLIMKAFNGSVLWETYKGAVRAQIRYGRKKKVPFGISESAFYRFDNEKNYQYKAFGVPKLEMRRDNEEELVISPYSTIMALQYCKEEGIRNLKALENIGAYGKYGFIEAVDYTPNRITKLLKEEVINEYEAKERKGLLIKTYMVHHIGMSLLALDNILKEDIMIERFHSIPEVKTTEIILKEKMENLVLAEKEGFINEEFKMKRVIFNTRVLSDRKVLDKGSNILSNGKYSVMINSLGGGYSKCDKNMIYRWGGDFLAEEGGVLFYIKDKKSKKIQSPTYYPFNSLGERYKVKFSEDRSEIQKVENGIETKLKILVSPEEDLEIRSLKIKNLKERDIELEITSYLEPIITTLEADLAHKAFSDLFIETEFLNGENILIAKRRTRKKEDKENYIFVSLVEGNNEDDRKLKFTTNRENFIKRNGTFQNPIGVEEELKNKSFQPLDPCIAIRKEITLEKGKEKIVNLIIGFTNDKKEIIKMVRENKHLKDIVRIERKYNKMASLLLNRLSLPSEKSNEYQKVLREILYIGEGRKFRDKYIKNIKGTQEDLWRYGISGDKKIILLKSKEDKKLLKDIIRFHYYMELKGIELDLIIYNEEEIDYNVRNRRDIDKLLNNFRNGDRKGIFILNKGDIDEAYLNFLIGIATIYINEDGDSFEKKLEYYEKMHKLDSDIEEDCKILLHLNDRKEEELEKDPIYIEKEEGNNLDFFNGYGGFNKEDGSYNIILKNKESTPRPWINVLSNKNFGTHISESGSSYTWCGNSRENKITPWSNDYIKDPMYEGIWFRDNTDLELFSIYKNLFDDGGVYKVNHNFGYSTFWHRSRGIEGNITVFVPLEEDLKIQIVKLKNLSGESKSISMFSYNELALGENKRKDNEKIYTEIGEEFAFAKKTYSKSFKEKIAYGTILGEGVNFYTCDIDEGREMLNKAIEENITPKSGGGYKPCLCTQKDIILAVDEEITLISILGQEESLEAIEGKINKYKDINNAFEELNRVKLEMDSFLGNIKINTGDKSFDYMMNGWLLYQNYNCRYLSRTAFYQSGGAYGFRDQMQDSLSLGIIKPEILRTQILKNASRQYIEGDVQHWWHPIVNSGIRTRFSDDLLWLPYGVIEYINLTGDYSILDEEVPYLDDEPLNKGEDERYTIVNNITEKDSIYNHCIKAINKALKYGSHGIPLMGSGDWNDGMSTVGNKGKGESVWLGWFLAKILKDFEALCIKKGEDSRAKEFEKERNFIIENIEINAWDGAWYKRAFFDDGTPLGSSENDECFIDSLPQSFSVITGLGCEERRKKAMESVEKYLVDRDISVIKLLHPPFESSKLEPGYIKGYVAGVRENGGQYTHAAAWVILAYSMLGENEKAYGFYNMINPINHSSTKEKADRYKVEPYVISADIYIRSPYEGRGGWSYYTGAAGWLYKIGLQNLIGLNKVKGKGYTITPHMPTYIDSFSIEIKDEKYKIKVSRGEKRILINGEKFENEVIPIGLGESYIEVYY